MDLDARAKDIRAVCDCLRYVQADIDKANLPIVSLHVGLAISEAQTVLDELAARQQPTKSSSSSSTQATGTGF